METFIGQLVGFALIIWLLAKYVAPAVRKLMTKQQDEIREQIAESDKATARLAEAEQSLEKAISDAQAEAARVREDARADAQRISEQLREQADAEVARIKVSGGEQIDLHRRQLVRNLQSDLATAALKQAEKNVSEKLAQPGERAATIDRFIDELERMADGSLVGRNEGRS